MKMLSPTSTCRLTLLGAASLLALALTGTPAPAGAQTPASTRWVDTWTSPLVSPANDNLAQLNTPPATFTNQTIRLITHTSVGGETVRVRISNVFGTQNLNVGAARIALRATAANTLPGTDRQLLFGGQPTVSIPPGALIVSDPVALSVPTLGDLAISLYFPDAATPVTTLQPFSHQSSYIATIPGDSTAAATFPANTSKTAWFFLTAVEVLAPSTVSTFVAFGDSITEGLNSTDNTNRRWTDRLAVRLFGQNTPWGIANEGISGNKVLVDQAGPSGLARFDREFIAHPGVTHGAVLLGINDINGNANGPDLIAGHRQFIARAHDKGLKIIGCTLTPSGEGAGTATETARQQLNAFIRGAAEYDALIDFDLATRDPNNPRFFLPAYDSGDALHPNDTGYQAMADAVDLTILNGFVTLNSVVSRKTHGASGSIDLPLPQGFGATPAIESRGGGAGGTYQLVFSFAAPVTAVFGAAVAEGVGTVSSYGADPNDASKVIVNLSGVTSGQYVTVGLTNVSDGVNTSSVRATFGVLVGDTNGDGAVNAGDIAQVKARSGQSVDGTNSRSDLNGDGVINAADIAFAKSQSGTALPPAPPVGSTP